ncbi:MULTISPECIES: hypothetical protein [unclassified Sphingobium]|uniref:hypothetical protein n=1 Tax=unclassified Sphingobium TaxID=2611147 RepID=UPI002223F4F4|nr:MULTISPECIES: hypothetical protein [unclassified Sphingobium]MCW2396160.1 hypothetical protein [Sphingobium sp. B8D3B]MCW2419676.1 hypothetical protein [Sphingobium sp. B8D3C]
MDPKSILPAAIETISSLTPALIGSAVAQAWKPGLNWRQRFVQWVVGSTVSFYATQGIVAFTGWNEFVAQSIGFGIALVAFDATPRVIASASDTLTHAPGRLSDLIFGKRKD